MHVMCLDMILHITTRSQISFCGFHWYDLWHGGTRCLTSLMVSSGLSCSIIAWRCLCCVSDALPPCFTGVVSRKVSLSSSRRTAPFTRAKLSLREDKDQFNWKLLSSVKCGLFHQRFVSTFSEVSLFFGGVHPSQKSQGSLIKTEM